MKKFKEWRAEEEYNELFNEYAPAPQAGGANAQPGTPQAASQAGAPQNAPGNDLDQDEAMFSPQDWTRLRAIANNRLTAAPAEIARAKRFLEPLYKSHPADKDFIMTTLAAAFALLSDRNVMNRSNHLSGLCNLISLRRIRQGHPLPHPQQIHLIIQI